MTGDREAVGLVANSLDETRSRRMTLGRHRRRCAVDEQPLVAHPALGALGDSDQRQVTVPELREHGVHLAHLPGTAIDQQQVGRRHLSGAHMAVAALERLAQRPVIVAGRNGRDVEAPVLLLQRSVGAEYDAGGHRALAARVADVEALDP